MRGILWTPHEDERLIHLRKRGHSLRQIADLIEGRSFNGVNGRLRILQRTETVR